VEAAGFTTAGWSNVLWALIAAAVTTRPVTLEEQLSDSGGRGELLLEANFRPVALIRALYE
jgi:hypothetical protein